MCSHQIYLVIKPVYSSSMCSTFILCRSLHTSRPMQLNWLFGPQLWQQQMGCTAASKYRRGSSRHALPSDGPGLVCLPCWKQPCLTSLLSGYCPATAAALPFAHIADALITRHRCVTATVFPLGWLCSELVYVTAKQCPEQAPGFTEPVLITTTTTAWRNGMEEGAIMHTGRWSPPFVGCCSTLC